MYVPTLHETRAVVKHEFDPFRVFGNTVVYLRERRLAQDKHTERTPAPSPDDHAALPVGNGVAAFGLTAVSPKNPG